MKLVFTLFLTALNAFAIPQLINYQGQLMSPSGTPLDTTVSMTFRIWTALAGGTADWTETHPVVTVTDGLFNVQLGFITSLPDLFAVDRWLGLAVGDDIEMIPRERIVSVAHAFRVGTVDGASGGTISGKVNVGVNNTNDGDYACVLGMSNVASGHSSFVGGGLFNTASGTRSTVGGGRINTASGAHSMVGGGSNNQARGQSATIAGGGELFSDSNSAIGDYSSIGGGFRNDARGYGSTINGGFGNDADSSVATVGGGSYNNATGIASTVGGGFSNTASGSYSTIGGGNDNKASGNTSTVGGGKRNHAHGDYAVIAGGGGNTQADSNSAIGDYSPSAVGFGTSFQRPGLPPSSAAA